MRKEEERNTLPLAKRNSMSIAKLAKQTALYGLSSIVGRVVSFLFLTPYLSYRFSEEPEQMGIQTELYAWAAFFNILLTYRMETAFLRFGAKEEERSSIFSTAQWSILGLVSFFLGMLALFSAPLAEFMGYSVWYIWLFVGILACDALAALVFAQLRLEERAGQFALVRLLNLALHLGGILFFLEFVPVFMPSYYAGNSAALSYVFGANLLASAATLLMLMPSALRLWKPLFDKALWLKLWRYSWPLLVASFAGIINEVLDRSLLRYFLPGSLEERLALIGIYGACYKLSVFMNLFTQAFNYAAEPFFFRHEQNKGKREVYAKVSLAFHLVACLAFLGVSLFMDIAQYFVAPVYRQGLGIVPILLLANLCLGLYYNVSIWYKLGEGKTRYALYISVFGAILTIAGNILLIPILGYHGSAWATLLCYASMLVASYYYGQKQFPIPYNVRKIALYLGFSLFAYALQQLLPLDALGRIVYAALVCLGFLLFVWKREARGLLAV